MRIKNKLRILALLLGFAFFLPTSFESIACDDVPGIPNEGYCVPTEWGNMCLEISGTCNCTCNPVIV